MLTNPTTTTARNRIALPMLALVFFMWGFITALNDILVPHLKAVFDLTYTRTVLIQFVFFGAYFLMSLPAAALLEKIGYKKAIVLGLGITGIGALIFIPAATLPSYTVFLTGLFVLATGITLLQVTANPYVALLGPAATASSRLNVVQALNAFGTTAAPLFGGLLILAQSTSGSANNTLQVLTLHQRLQDALAVRAPYFGIAIVLFLLALMIYRSRLPNPQSQAESAIEATDNIRQQKRLVLGLGAIFFYVGAEVSIGSFLINYLSLPTVAKLSHADAAFYVSLFWGLAMVGRLIGAGVMQRIAPASVLSITVVGAMVLLGTSILSAGALALWTIVLIGLMNSIMFPTIFTLAIEGLGALTARGSALLIMAVVGGAIVPLVQGILADGIGLRLAFIAPIICYGYVLFFALYCRKQPRNNPRAPSISNPA